MIALGAASQTKGRGTSGRAWVGLGGNAFLTLAIPYNAMPFPITLLPLRIGILVAKGKKKREEWRGLEPNLSLSSSPLAVVELVKVLPADKGQDVSLKWPNDVLIGNDKVSGLLIEMDGSDRFLIGIGVNVAQVFYLPIWLS